MKNPYWEIIKGDLPRLLSLLDTNPISKTYGSFDRSYWHHRRVDFSSSALQQGSLILSVLYDTELDENPFYQNKNILELIVASLEYVAKIQHKDGSFDEWYPQERGWAGPTGYILYSTIRSLELVGPSLDQGVLNKLRICAERAVGHLLNYEELDVLSNHQAMSLLAIISAQKYFGLEISEDKMKCCWNNFTENFSTEGWSLEYDGCDPGYQTATLSFLSRLYRCAPSEEIRSLCLRQVDFLQNFVFPDFSFAGPMGSRGTSNVFHFGFECWAKESTQAAYLADILLQGVLTGSVLSPKDQEDHYLVYRMLEFAECARDYQGRKHQMTWKQKVGTVFFKDAGIYVRSDENYFGAINVKKGGAGKIYSLNEKCFIFRDEGYFFEDQSGNLYTSGFFQNDRAVSVVGNTLTIEGFCNRYQRPVFGVLTFLIFRMTLLLSRHARIALLLKSWIRSKITTQFSKTNGIKVKRTIHFEPKIKISDRIMTKNLQVRRFIRSYSLPPRAVPQSCYCSSSSLGLPSTGRLDTDQLNRQGSIAIEVL